MKKLSTDRFALIVSLALHVLFALGLLMIKFELKITPVQHLIEVVNYGVKKPVENASNLQEKRGLEQPRSNKIQGTKSANAPEKINLPKSSSISDEEVFLPADKVTAFSDLQETDISGNSHLPVRSGLKSPALNASETENNSEKASVKADKDFLADLRKRITANDGSNGGYSLSGEIINRKILNQIIPDYPAGLQQNSEVEILFEVNPDGSVRDNVIITKKGGPQLDQVSLEAIKKWKFNPITGEHIQSGTIKFKYKLE